MEAAEYCKAAALAAIGVDHVLIDDGDLAAAVSRLVTGGGDAALELVGTHAVIEYLTLQLYWYNF